MKKMRFRHFLRFIFSLFVVLLPVFLVHFIFCEPKWRQELFLTYGYNCFSALLFLAVFFLKEKTIKPYLGYYFLYFSLFKFSLFLAFIQPFLDLSGGVKGHAFLSFFVPYVLCLLIEVRFVINELTSPE
jgi:hypothetical protein